MLLVQRGKGRGGGRGGVIIGVVLYLHTELLQGRNHPFAYVKGFFEVGGASALSQSRRLDRHWRNARVLSSHNPMIYRAKLVGSALLHGGHEARQYTVGAAKI